MKYPKEQFEVLVRDLPVVLNYYGFTPEMLIDDGALCDRMHYVLYSQKNYPDTNLNVKFVNGKRLLPMDESFKLYPDGCIDKNIFTAMRAAALQLRGNKLKTEPVVSDAKPEFSVDTMPKHYLATNELGTEYHEITAADISTARHWVINHLDLSLNWTVQPKVNPAEMTIEQLKAGLAAHGYITTSMWNVADVDNAIQEVEQDYNVAIVSSLEDKMKILETVFGFESDKSSDNVSLYDAVKEKYLTAGDEVRYESDPTGLDNDLQEEGDND